MAADGALIRARVETDIWPEEAEARAMLAQPLAVAVIEDPLIDSMTRLDVTGPGAPTRPAHRIEGDATP